MPVINQREQDSVPDVNDDWRQCNNELASFYTKYKSLLRAFARFVCIATGCSLLRPSWKAYLKMNGLLWSCLGLISRTWLPITIPLFRKFEIESNTISTLIGQAQVQALSSGFCGREGAPCRLNFFSINTVALLRLQLLGVIGSNLVLFHQGSLHG